MIGGIDSKYDITVFLQAKEIERVSNEVLEGIIIKIEEPEKQWPLFVSVNDKRSYDGGYGIGVQDNRHSQDSDKKIELFIGNEWYQRLQSAGAVELRHGTHGSKVCLSDASKGMEAIAKENLEQYIDNPNKT